MATELLNDYMMRKIAELERRLAQLEQSRQSYGPIYSQPWQQFTQPPGKPTCPKCGLCLEGVMSYNCAHIGCPTGLGGPSSKT